MIKINKHIQLIQLFFKKLIGIPLKLLTRIIGVDYLLRRCFRFLIVKLNISEEAIGVWFLKELLQPRIDKSFNEKISIGGLTIQLDLSNKYQHQMYYGHYEQGLTKIMKKVLVPGSTFIDVGANIGYVSAQAAIQVGRNGVVHSFEPVPEYFLRLKVMAQNVLGYNIIVNQHAVGDKEGKVEIRTCLDGNIGWNTMVPGLMSDTNTKKIIEVSLMKPDSYIYSNRVENIAMIKIDVEGAEFLVLKGLEEFFASGNRPPIFCEVSPEAVSLLSASIDQLFSYMSKFGYNSYIYKNYHWRPIQWGELVRTADILFM